MATSNKRNWETHEKIALKGREAQWKPGDFT